MQVSVETLEGLQRRIKVQIPADEIDRKVENRLRSVGRTAKLPGFRPGKIPLKVIRQRYGGQVRREVLGEVMQSSFGEAISQEKLHPAGGPKIEPESIEQGTDLEYTATFEVYPEIKIGGTSGLKLTRPVADISADDVDRVIEDLRVQRAEWAAVDMPAADGHRVIVDFAGSIDGVPFDGGAGDKVPVELGSGGMLEDFENGLRGTTAGQTTVFDVNFPQDYHAADLAGKTAQFEATVHSIEARELPEIDAAFIEAFGIEEGGEEALRSGVRDNMQAEMDARVDAQMRNQVLEAFLKANPLDVPTALVADEVRALQDESMRRMGVNDENERPPAEPFEQQARQRVAIGLLLNEYIRKNAVEPEEARVDARLESLVAGHDNTDALMRAYRSSDAMMQRIRAMALEDMVVAQLLEQADVTKQTMTFRELMNLDR